MLSFLLFLILAGSAWWDRRTGRIPNKWLLGCAASYLLLCLIRGPARESGAAFGFYVFLAESAGFLARASLFTAVSFPLFFFRMMGAGDIKLMALICGCFGMRDGFTVIICGLAASAVWSLFYMIKNHIFLKRIQYFINYFTVLYQKGQRAPYYLAERDNGQVSFCLAPFLLGGFCLWLAIR